MEEQLSQKISGEQDPSLIQTRLVDILHYIEKVEQLSQDPFYSVNQHKSGFVAFEQDVRGLPRVHFNSVSDVEDETWLKIERILPEGCPEVPTYIKSWVTTYQDPSKEPVIKDTLIIKNADLKTQEFYQLSESSSKAEENNLNNSARDSEVEMTLNIQDFPEVSRRYDEYFTGAWKSWSLREVPRRRTIELYGKLFELHRTIELESGTRPLEVVWGVGVALLSGNSYPIKYPLITQLVELVLDISDNSILIRPRNNLPRLEASAFYALNNPGTSLFIERGKVWLKDTGQRFTPFLKETFEEILRAGVFHLDKSGRYWPDHRSTTEDRSLPSPSDTLVVTDTWVVFARPRTSNFLLDDVAKLKKAVLESDSIGDGPSAIVSDPTDEVPEPTPHSFRGLCGVESSYGKGSSLSQNHEAPAELFFPKPYNREQLCIVDMLEQRDGVVVQGPPGTGKTHTIANIICHYLASGKRVLVTSKGEPALAVIREQIPEGIRTLVVSILTNEREGLRQVQNSVEQIATEVTSASSHALRSQIDELKGRLDVLHEKIAAWDREISSIAESHLSTVPFGDAQMRPAEMAEEIMKEFEIYSWFPDKLGVGDVFMPRITQSDLVTLAEARKKVGNRLCYLNVEIPSAENFWDPDRLLEIHANRVDFFRLTEETRDPRLPRLKDTNIETIQKAEVLQQLVRDTIKLTEKLTDLPVEWAVTLHNRFRHSRHNPAVQLISQLGLEIQESEKLRLTFISDSIEVPENSELLEPLKLAIDRAANGDRPFGFFNFADRTTKDMFKKIRLNGVPPQNTAGWKTVSSFLGYLFGMRELTNKWNGLCREIGAPEIVFTREKAAHELLSIGQAIALAEDLAVDSEEKLKLFCDEVFAKNAIETGFYSELSNLIMLESLLARYLPRHKLRVFEEVTEDLLSKITNGKGEIIVRVKQFIQTRLGSADESYEQLRLDWENCLSELRTIEALRPSFAAIQQITDEIQNNGAPNWAEKLRTEPVVDVDHWLPPDSLRAWEWKLKHAYLCNIDQREKLKLLISSKIRAEIELTSTYEDYVRTRTWLSLKNNLSNRCRSALQAYLTALRNLGKGKGKTVRGDRFREDARRAMEDAYAAVPCWIMPHWRVSETLPSEVGLFDLVIIDEASQSDIWAFPALLRGKKILVVGDDEQISPTTFAKEEDIIRLRDQYLSNLPYNFQAQVLPGKSIYDLARVVFPQSHITLIEHFRCVSPIIQFSNQLCYNGRIQCLRVPKASERIDPPLVDVLIKGGYRNGKKNPAEARAIVCEIENIVNSQRYQNRSIGVVSLLGHEQAHLINGMILEKFGEDIIQRHNILCGDSMTFQGNERDIMFLSMVATAEESVAQTKREIRQRFNVATSRARDRMYLYRSVYLEDLSGTDLRGRLVDYFENPPYQDTDKSESLRDQCQSSFESAVFDALVQKGYRVVPQVPCADYYIDMVVEGNNDCRLAIECDGDQYHGPARWAEDYKRQRVLERAGWRFWRCWGSSFYLDPEGCFADLIATLQEMGIEPLGVDNSVRFDIVEHRVIDPNTADVFATPSQSLSDISVPDSPAFASEEPNLHTPVKDDYQEKVLFEQEQPRQTSLDFNNSVENIFNRTDGKIDIGELVEYCFVDSPDEIHRFRIIEIGTTNLNEGVINITDSLGQILIGLSEQDEVVVQTPSGAKLIRITKIHDLPSENIYKPFPGVSNTPAIRNIDTSLADAHESRFQEIARAYSENSEVSNFLSDGLCPYTQWEKQQLPDPRVSRSREILNKIIDIVAAEGPIITERVYHVYCESAGLGRRGSEIKIALDKAVLNGVNRGLLLSTNEFRAKNRLKNILRIPGKQALLPREVGGRNFEEIPPTEIAAAMRVICNKTPALSVDDLYRQTLSMFGFRRLTASFRATLSLAYNGHFLKEKKQFQTQKSTDEVTADID